MHTYPAQPSAPPTGETTRDADPSTPPAAGPDQAPRLAPRQRGGTGDGCTARSTVHPRTPAGGDRVDLAARDRAGRAALAAVRLPEVDEVLDAIIERAPPLPDEIRMRLAHLLGWHRPPPSRDGGDAASGAQPTGSAAPADP